MGQIVIYVDQGVSGESLRHTVKSLQKEVCLEKHPLKRIDAQTLKKTDWEKEAALLIIPGGRDVFYTQALKGEGTDKIARFVKEGGSYLGLCAGAYFAAHSIEFEKGCSLEVCGERDLRMYPGLAKGAAYGSNKYSPYNTEAGAEAALISWGKTPHFVYFNGGCFFVKPEAYPTVEVLATYSDLKEDPAAIVCCQFGKGKALLSGVHFEFSAHALNKESPYLKRIIPLLEKGEERRRELMRAMLQKLGIALR
jgi:glutamine amidotransferase-like uncharacterized protein